MMGKLEALADLRVNGVEGPLDNVFAAGDCAAVPDLASGEGKFCPPNAQHAVRQGKRVADNIARSVQGRPMVDYYHKNLGVMATLGMYKGVGRLNVADKELDIRGLPAWAMARAYHVYAMPTLGRKGGGHRRLGDQPDLPSRHHRHPAVLDAARGLRVRRELRQEEVIRPGSDA